MQPFDVSFSGPLKSAYSRECELFMRNHLYEKIRVKDIPSLFNTAYQKVSAIAKAMSGFSQTLVYPLNPDAFS
jgi:hypothetical protein